MRHVLRLAVLLLCACSTVGVAWAASAKRVSVATGGAQGTGGTSDDPSISTNGRFVAFHSGATGLVSGDTNSRDDIFVHDRQTGITQRVSLTHTGAQANGNSREPSISADGRYVVFTSDADNLVPDDTNMRADIFLRDRTNNTTERISVDSGEGQVNDTSNAPAISGNGQFVAFLSVATNLVPGDTTTGSNGIDVFVRDRPNGTTERVSVMTGGGQAGSGPAYPPSISADGRFVTFASRKTDLVPGDTTTFGDVFLHDRQSDATTRISVSSGGSQALGGESHQPTISPDGRLIVFTSLANNLVSGDTNNQYDIFVRDRTAGTTIRVNLSNTGAQATSGSSYEGSISADGRFVVFRSLATNLIPSDTNSRADIFRRDRVAGRTIRVSENFGGGHTLYDSYLTGISGDGRVVVFDSNDDRIVTGDTNGWRDVFAREYGNLQNDLLVDFGARGLYQRMNNATWVKVHASNPLAIAVGDLDGGDKEEAIASFPGLGLYARYNNAGAFVKLHNTPVTRFVAGNLDGGGKEIIVDLGASGIYARYNNAGAFVRLHPSTSQQLAMGDLDGNGRDELLIDLSTGLWVRRNNVNPWVRLHATSPTVVATGDLDGNGKDEVIGFFPGRGVLALYNNAGAWVRLHTLTAQGLATGDFDGNGKDDLVADFGASGLYVRYNNAGAWVRRHASNPLRIVTADLEKNGKDEAIASFAGTGVFARRNNVDPRGPPPHLGRAGSGRWRIRLGGQSRRRARNLTAFESP